MNNDDNLLVRRGLQLDQACRRRTQCSPHQLLTNPLLPPSFQQQSFFQRFQQLSCVQLSDLTSCRLDATTSASAAVAVVWQSSTSMLSSLHVAKYAFEKRIQNKKIDLIKDDITAKLFEELGTDQIEMGNKSYGEKIYFVWYIRISDICHLVKTSSKFGKEMQALHVRR